MTKYDPMGPLRARVQRTIAENAVALGAPPAGEAAPRYELAMEDWRKAAIKAGMRISGADRGFDRTIGRMTHGEFKPSEIHELEERSLNALEWEEAKVLRGVAEGPPVTFTPAQKAIVDSLMGRLGEDALAQRTKDAYERALREGQVRVRGR